MTSFSEVSLRWLNTCHADIVCVCRELIKQYDFCVLEGHRGKEAQNIAYKQGNSRLVWPNSAHNKYPSLGVDLAPYPLDWQNLERFKEMIYRFDALAHLLRERGEIHSHFIYGAFWKKWQDYPHIEIKQETEK